MESETFLEPSAPFLQNELEAAEFRKHGLTPVTHFTDSVWDRVLSTGKAKLRIKNVTKVHDWRDGVDYLTYTEEATSGSQKAERMVGGYNLPVIADGKVIKYRPFFDTPFTKENLQLVVKRADDRTTWGYSELALSESCCKGYREVSAAEFLEGVL